MTGVLEFKFVVQGNYLSLAIEDLAVQITKVRASMLRGESYIDPRFDSSNVSNPDVWSTSISFTADNGNISEALATAAVREASFSLGSAISNAVEQGELLTTRPWIEQVRARRAEAEASDGIR